MAVPRYTWKGIRPKEVGAIVKYEKGLRGAWIFKTHTNSCLKCLAFILSNNLGLFIGKHRAGRIRCSTLFNGLDIAS